MKRAKQIVAVSLLVPVVGCTALRPVATPDQYISQARPDRVYVFQGDQTVTVIDEPQVRGNQLTGRFAGTVVPAEFPLSDVSQVRVRTSAPAKTALLAGGIVGGVGMIVYLATRQDFDPNRPYCPQYYCVGGGGYGNPPETRSP